MPEVFAIYFPRTNQIGFAAHMISFHVSSAACGINMRTKKQIVTSCLQGLKIHEFLIILNHVKAFHFFALCTLEHYVKKSGAHT